MADLLGEDGAQTQQEEDPAAAFLAREQDDLAGLEDDSIGGSGNEPPPVPDQFDAFAEQAPEQSSGNDFLNEFDPQVPSDMPSSGDPSSADDLFGGETIEQEPDMGGFEPVPQQNGPSDAYSAITNVDRERAEPEKIRIWREQQKERLEKKDEEEEMKKVEWREAAKKELDDWYKHQSEQLEKTKVTNRQAEEAFLKERDQIDKARGQAESAFVQERDSTVGGEEWDRICRLCDFNPKASKNSRDVSRMRSILLQLKQTPLAR